MSKGSVPPPKHKAIILNQTKRNQQFSTGKMSACAFTVPNLQANGVVHSTTPTVGLGNTIGAQYVQFGFEFWSDKKALIDAGYKAANPAYGGPDRVTLSCPAGQTLRSDLGIVSGGTYEVICENSAPSPNVKLLDDILAPLTCLEPATTTTGMMGDPHVKKWDGTWYDWQGECDAVLLHAPDFHDGLGLDVHTRTRIRYDYSFIESVAVRIGPDILEVSSFGWHTLNGVANPSLPHQMSMGDCCIVTQTEVNENEHHFIISMGKDMKVKLSTHKDIVSIKILHGESPKVNDWFRTSSGLMGSFPEGKMLARDGDTILDNPSELGQEWQVLDSDPTLFQSERAPQFPAKCNLPIMARRSASQTHRRLLKDEERRLLLSRGEASKACARWNDDDERENCIKDVLATNDLSLGADSNGY